MPSSKRCRRAIPRQCRLPRRSPKSFGARSPGPARLRCCSLSSCPCRLVRRLRRRPQVLQAAPGRRSSQSSVACCPLSRGSPASRDHAHWWWAPCTGGEAVPDGPGLADRCNAEGCVERACYWPSITRTRVFGFAAPMPPRGGVTCHVALGECLPAAFRNGLLQHQPLRYKRRTCCNSVRGRHVVPVSAQRTSTLIGADCEDSTLFTSTAETAK